MSEPGAATTPGSAAAPNLRHIFRVFLMAGAISFGGGVVAYMREFIVRGEKWLDDDEFLDALEVSQTLPGLNSVNMSVVVGDRLRGIPGAIAALLGILLPGMTVVMTLGVIWESRRHNPDVTAFLIGIAASAVGLLAAVTVQLGHRQFTHWLDLSILAVTFFLVSYLHVSLVIVLLVVGPISVWIYRPGSHHGEREIPMPHPHFRHRHHLLRH